MWWRFVFWWKKRTGFIDFKEDIEVVGTVTGAFTARDGDVTFNVWPDDEYLWSVTWYGGRLKTKLHCEVVPWMPECKALAADLKVGDRVRVCGAWGFDGVHTRKRWKVWHHYVWEVLAAVFRHQPNVHDGWFEIHPVTRLERLPAEL